MDMLSAIIFINKDLTDQVKGVLQQQLYISQTMSFTEFNSIIDGYVADGYTDAYYGEQIHLLKKRILVILPDMTDVTNRELADIVCVFKHGLIYIEQNKYGYPGTTFRASNITISQLVRNSPAAIGII
jgi:hypothetical protein